jgi:VanZ family protein
MLGQPPIARLSPGLFMKPLLPSRPWRRWLAVAIAAILLFYWGAIFLATHTPPVDMPTDIPYGDKLAHFTAFAGLAFLLTLALYIWRPFRWRWLLVAVMIAALYGMLDEFTQSYVGRHADVRDWLADVAGAVCGASAGLVTFLAVRGICRRIFSASGQTSMLLKDARDD